MTTTIEQPGIVETTVNQAEQIAKMLHEETGEKLSVSVEHFILDSSTWSGVNINVWRGQRIDKTASGPTMDEAIAKFRKITVANPAAFGGNLPWTPEHVAPCPHKRRNGTAAHSPNSITFHVERNRPTKPDRNGVVDWEPQEIPLAVYYDHYPAEPKVNAVKSVMVTEILDADGRNFINDLEPGEMQLIKDACWEDVRERVETAESLAMDWPEQKSQREDDRQHEEDQRFEQQ